MKHYSYGWLINVFLFKRIVSNYYILLCHLLRNPLKLRGAIKGSARVQEQRSANVPMLRILL